MSSWRMLRQTRAYATLLPLSDFSDSYCVIWCGANACHLGVALSVHLAYAPLAGRNNRLTPSTTRGREGISNLMISLSDRAFACASRGPFTTETPADKGQAEVSRSPARGRKSDAGSPQNGGSVEESSSQSPAMRGKVLRPHAAPIESAPAER